MAEHEMVTTADAQADTVKVVVLVQEWHVLDVPAEWALAAMEDNGRLSLPDRGDSESWPDYVTRVHALPGASVINTCRELLSYGTEKGTPDWDLSLLAVNGEAMPPL